MAEVVGIVAGIGSILKTLTSTGIFLQNVGSASREAQEVASQVHDTEAILKSLQASLHVLRRPQEFHDIWGHSTKLVLSNVKVTAEQLNKKLSSKGGKARLSLWGKVKWPLQREETVVLQQHMQAYMQMLSMVQNAYIQGNMQCVHESAKGIDDIFTEVATLPSSIAPSSVVTLSDTKEGSIVPDDSISLAGSRHAEENLAHPGQPLVALEEDDPSGPLLGSARSFDAHLFHGETLNSDLVDLGVGRVDLTLAKDHRCIWILFKFSQYPDEELRWFSSSLTTFSSDLIIRYVVQGTRYTQAQAADEWLHIRAETYGGARICTVFKDFQDAVRVEQQRRELWGKRMQLLDRQRKQL